MKENALVNQTMGYQEPAHLLHKLHIECLNDVQHRRCHGSVARGARASFHFMPYRGDVVLGMFQIGRVTSNVSIDCAAH